MRSILLFGLLLLSFSSPVFAADSGLGTVDWRNWRTLPVYDEGRAMPLDTFARLSVMQICKTHRPLIVMDEMLLGSIEPSRFSGTPEAQAKEAERIRKRIEALFPDGVRVFEPYELLFSWIAEPEIWEYIPFLPAKSADFRSEVLMLPLVGRSGRIISGVAPFQLERSRGYEDMLQRVRERQLKAAHRPSRSAETDEEEPERELSEEEKTAIELHNTLTVYRNLVRRPNRNVSDLSVSFVSALQQARTDFSAASRAWDQAAERGLTRFLPKSTVPPNERFNAIALVLSQLFQNFSSEKEDDQPISQGRIERQLNAILLLLDQAVAESETILDRLYQAETGQQSSGPNKDTAPEPAIFSAKNEPRLSAYRTDAITLHVSLLSLRRYTQAALISIFGEGRTIRVLPALLDDAIRPDIAGISERLNVRDLGPWVPLALVLRGEPTTIRRFVDPDFPLNAGLGSLADWQEIFGSDLSVTLGPEIKRSLGIVSDEPATVSSAPAVKESSTDEKNQLTSVAEDNQPHIESGKEPPTDENLSAQEVFDRLIVEKTKEALGSGETATSTSGRNSTAALRSAFRDLVLAYTDRTPGSLSEQEPDIRDETKDSSGAGNETAASPELSRTSRFASGLSLFAQSLRETAERTEPVRENLLPEAARDAEILAKTAYPRRGAVDPEYLYYRFDPFYWMGITAFAATVALLLSFVLEFVRRKSRSGHSAASVPQSSVPETVDSRPPAPFAGSTSLANIGIPSTYSGQGGPRKERGPFSLLSLSEETLFWLGVLFLFLSEAVIFWGGAMRAYISGWAPVSNMFETLVLMAFSAACLGLWFSLQPLLGPPLGRAWNLTAFPWRFLRKSASANAGGAATNAASSAPGEPAAPPAPSLAELYGEMPGMLPSGAGYTTVPSPAGNAGPSPGETAVRIVVPVLRIGLMLLTFWGVIVASYHESSDETGIAGAVVHSFAMTDPIDWTVVAASLLAIVWFVPRFLLALVLFPLAFFFPKRFREAAEEETEDSTPGKTRKRMLRRKVFVLFGALVVLIAGIVTTVNPTDFNPNIRPLAAVLRSNFWLAVHVIAIMVSYAAGVIAWLLALTSLGVHIFGRYRRVEQSPKKIIVLSPAYCEALTPYIRKMVNAAIWLLMLGTILGARWADYSWGRFWSWDVKEVWALVTLLIFLTAVHGRIARLYGDFGVLIGTVFGAIAIGMTWYGFNFVFSTGRHAYAASDSHWAANILVGFIVLNLLWASVAVLRYWSEKSNRSSA